MGKLSALLILTTLVVVTSAGYFGSLGSYNYYNGRDGFKYGGQSGYRNYGGYSDYTGRGREVRGGRLGHDGYGIRRDSMGHKENEGEIYLDRLLGSRVGHLIVGYQPGGGGYGLYGGTGS